MKLHLTANSERGKPITKSGNEYIKIEIFNQARKLVGKLHILDKDNEPYIYYEGLTNKNYYVDLTNSRPVNKPKTARESFLTCKECKEWTKDCKCIQPKTSRAYCFQCSPDGKYTIKGVCEVCEGINKRADETAREEIHSHDWNHISDHVRECTECGEVDRY